MSDDVLYAQNNNPQFRGGVVDRRLWAFDINGNRYVGFVSQNDVKIYQTSVGAPKVIISPRVDLDARTDFVTQTSLRPVQFRNGASSIQLYHGNPSNE